MVNGKKNNVDILQSLLKGDSWEEKNRLYGFHSTLRLLKL